MSKQKCPKCGGDVEPVPNARNKNTNKCSQCGKLVASGNAGKSTENTEKTRTEKTERKPKKAAPARRAAAPANRTKGPAATERPATGKPASGGFLSRLIDWLPDSPLSAEAERLLSGVQAHIGDEGDEAADPALKPEGDQGGEMVAMMGGYVFSQQDIHDTLIEFFDFLGERFDSDHWRLKERQARMLAEPGTLLVNACWQKLARFLPEYVQRLCETTPGLLAFIVASGLIVLPRVKTQISISRQRAKAPAQVRPAAAQPAASGGPKPEKPPSHEPLTITEFDGPGPHWT